jgi:hypothetical protein
MLLKENDTKDIPPSRIPLIRPRGAITSKTNDNSSRRDDATRLLREVLPPTRLPMRKRNPLSNAKIPIGSLTIPTSELKIPLTAIHPTSDDAPDNKDQTEIPPTPALAQTSVHQIQTITKHAGPRTERATCDLWEVSSDDMFYRSTAVPYLMLVAVEIRLNGKQKMCHWGCLDNNGRPTVLSSPE